MKILHIAAGELTGGAARGAYWLHTGLREIGVESKILTNSTTTLGDEKVVSIITDKKTRIKSMIRSQLDGLFLLFYKNRKKIIFSTGFFGFDFTKTPEYKEADIIHLHWINGGFVSIKHLAKIKKPIVWTMRDMWPMTGGCHYALDCEKYKTGCGACMQLNSKNKKDLSSIVLRRKKKYISRNIKLVGISDWLSEEAKKSRLFIDYDVRTISNNIDAKIFYPIGKKEAKKICGIDSGKKVILVGSTSLDDFYKGFGKFLEAVEFLDKDKYYICSFGGNDKKMIKETGFEYKNFGFLHDNISLQILYSAADVFVGPSIQEAFGKTLAESMACGTPVVCFDTTGPKDIVTHKIDGYKANPFESEDLANGIKWVLNNENYDELCRNARKKVVENFDIKIIAGKYKKLYEEILNKK